MPGTCSVNLGALYGNGSDSHASEAWPGSCVLPFNGKGIKLAYAGAGDLLAHGVPSGWLLRPQSA